MRSTLRQISIAVRVACFVLCQSLVGFFVADSPLARANQFLIDPSHTSLEFPRMPSGRIAWLETASVSPGSDAESSRASDGIEQRDVSAQQVKEKEALRAAAQAEAQLLLRALSTDGKFNEDKLRDILGASKEVRIIIANLDPDHAGLDKAAWTRMQVFLLKNDPDTNIRSLAASALGDEHASELARNALLEALGSESSDVRLFACHSLMLCKDKSHAAAIVKLLRDPNREVRRVAVRTLGWLGNAEHVAGILKLYQSEERQRDEDWVFADALARLGEEKTSLAVTVECMKSENWNVRFFAVESLGFNHSRQVAPVIMSLLADELRQTVKEMKTVRVGDRVYVGLCQELSKRSGKQFGTDVVKWYQWWSQAEPDPQRSRTKIDFDAMRQLKQDYGSLKNP